MFDRFRKLTAIDLSESVRKVRFVYGTAGKYYLSLGVEHLPLAPAAGRGNARILFSPEVRELDATLKPWKWEGGSVNLPGIAVGDLNGDGNLDLVLTGVGEKGGSQVFFGDGKGSFTPGPRLADQAVSPCLGDVDNNGTLDLWLGRAGEDLLYLNDGKGNLTKAPPVSNAAGKRMTVCARLFDIDNDGDLDLISLRSAGGSVPARGDGKPAPSGVWRNNRDGSFVDIAASLGLAFEQTPMASLLYADFNNGRRLDVIAFPAAKPPVLWVNDLAGRYHLLDAAATGLKADHAASAICGDPNKDGRPDVLVFTGDEVRLFLNRGQFHFEEDQEFAKRFSKLGGTSGQFVDIDDDGDLDLVIADAHRRDGTRGPVLLINDWPRQRFLDAAEADPGNLLSAIHFQGDASCVAADFFGHGRCDLLLAPSGGKPMLVQNVTRGGHCVEIDLVGTREQNNTTRSDHSSIGARVEVKSGMIFQQYLVGACSGAVSMPPLRVHAGIGDNTKVDWLRVFWPDGVFQGETEIAGDRLFQVSEVQKHHDSCAHLFAWNGSRFELVCDFGGMGGLGYLTGPGKYNTPDPIEYVRIPQLAPRGRDYVLQVLEPLEEVTYLDEVKLIAVDHPAGMEVYPNEMMAVNTPRPSFEVLCIKNAIEPVHAVDNRGVDVTEAIRRTDRQYAGATELDPRFKGFAKEHFVELDFGDRLVKGFRDSRLFLFLQGSVEYETSTSSFAAAQAGLRLKAPSIFVERGGRWVELLHEAGYPAGILHTMTLDVTGKILPGDRKIRIASNMELYWDRIFLAEHHPGEKLSFTESPVRSADLHFFGYPREYSPDGRKPNLFDYDNIDRSAGWNLFPGDYTRYGEVGELLKEADDCYVIMAHGDEVTLRFPVEAFGPIPPGCRRTFLLKTDSYCKDIDSHTAFPGTVAPLPFHAMSGFPYGAQERYPETAKTKQYRERYNTRKIRTE